MYKFWGIRFSSKKKRYINFPLNFCFDLKLLPSIYDFSYFLLMIFITSQCLFAAFTLVFHIPYELGLIFDFAIVIIILCPQNNSQFQHYPSASNRLLS